MATENSPLLNQTSPYGSVEVQDEDTGMISVVTSINKPNDDDLLARRLKGASLMVVLLLFTLKLVLNSKDGRVSDALGRRRTILFATIIFFIGSGLCGASNSLWALVISRTIAGVGGGGMNTMSAVITSDLVSLRERGKYQGYANIAYGLGSVIGAPLGGLITDHIGWRYCFYINLPLLLISIYVGLYLLNDYNLDEQATEDSLYDRFKQIDFLGAFFVVVAVVCFLIATSLGGNSVAWSDPIVYGLLIASVVMGLCFCWVEAKVAQNPLMPWHIISARTPFASSMANFFGIMCSFAMTYTTPLFFQGVLGYSSSQAGLFFLPKVVAMSCGSLSSGFWMARTGEYRQFITFSALVALVAMIGISLWTPTSSLVFIVFCLILDGFSSGALVTTALVSMLSCVGSTDMATITSISYLFRSTGGVIGISVTSAIFQGVVKHILSERITGPDRDAIIDIARKSMNQVRELLPPDALEIVLDTYQVAVRYAFYYCIIISILGVISTLFIQQYQLHSKLK
ncbi:major facilitator superfamily domain-containing protein [Blakeslea trispora]|nr:major facilitator superfamily domain-containing protein [Blakeslea trispora]